MYDTIIVGAGPAGISASLYTKRANLKTLVIYKGIGALEKAEKVENFYGTGEPIGGKKLVEQGIKQAEELGVELVADEVIDINIEENGKRFKIITPNREYISKTVILATGNSKKKSKIKGIKEFEGKGVSYCAICDAFFYKGKKVGVLGSGNYALHEYRSLEGVAKEVTILTNSQELVQNRGEEIEAEVETRKIKEITGEERIKKVIFEDNESIDIDGLFIAEGIANASELAKKIGIYTKEEKIVVDESMKTNIQGIYACGDCTGGLLQISKAVYEGTKAGLSVIEKVKDREE